MWLLFNQLSLVCTLAINLRLFGLTLTVGSYTLIIPSSNWLYMSFLESNIISNLGGFFTI